MPRTARQSRAHLQLVASLVLTALIACTAACSTRDDNTEAADQPSESLADMFDPKRNANEPPLPVEPETPVDIDPDDVQFADVPDTQLCQLVVSFKKNNSFMNQMTTELVRTGRGSREQMEESFINTKPELLQAAQTALASVKDMRDLVPPEVTAALMSQQVLIQNSLDSLLDAESFTDFANDTSNYARSMLGDLIESGFIYNPYIKDECQITLT